MAVLACVQGAGATVSLVQEARIPVRVLAQDGDCEAWAGLEQGRDIGRGAWTDQGQSMGKDIVRVAWPGLGQGVGKDIGRGAWADLGQGMGKDIGRGAWAGLEQGMGRGIVDMEG